MTYKYFAVHVKSIALFLPFITIKNFEYDLPLRPWKFWPNCRVLIMYFAANYMEGVIRSSRSTRENYREKIPIPYLEFCPQCLVRYVHALLVLHIFQYHILTELIHHKNYKIFFRIIFELN